MKKTSERLNKFKLSLHAVHLKSLNRVFPPIQLITHKITIACQDCNDTSWENYTFMTFVQNRILWVLIEIASVRQFQSLPTIYDSKQPQDMSTGTKVYTIIM